MSERVPEALGRYLGSPPPRTANLSPVRLIDPICRPGLLCDCATIRTFYGQRSFCLVWSDSLGPLPRAYDLFHRIRDAHGDGMDPGPYHTKQIRVALKIIQSCQAQDRTPDRTVLQELDILLTDAFLGYAAHLSRGRTHPDTSAARWSPSTGNLQLISLLQSALQRDNILETMNQLQPRHRGYADLHEALTRYLAAARHGGWPRVEPGPPLRNGDRDPRVTALRRRLAASGDLTGPESPDPARFDDNLEYALRLFQYRNGLPVQGVAGPPTVRSLNVPVAERLRRVELNLERWKWLPQNLGPRYIMVNTAAFSLELVEAGKTSATMKVITGRGMRSTPTLTSMITTVVVNPYWNIPHKLAVRDILPRIHRDPNYLYTREIRVFESWKPGAPELDRKSIDWSDINRFNMAYKLRQDPGPRNALGTMKFLLPNKRAVYLHDTPDKHLFQMARRDRSAGCVRVENPLELAMFLLQGDPQWTREQFREAIASKKNTWIPLRQPVPVYIVYRTVWVDGNGLLHFRDDIAGHDRSLENEIRKAHPLNHEHEPGRERRFVSAH